jgi:hypothetical protein
MNLAVQAYSGLYGQAPNMSMDVKFHGRLQGYNATVRKTAREIVFRLSPQFMDVEPEIQIGVMQFLLNKLQKTKVRTDEIDMYHTFLRKLSEVAPVTKSDPVLEVSFQRVNAAYFGGMMSQPNLVWGGHSTSLLGTYTYATDTIMISQVLKEDENLLDYVMYHEALHKKHKFSSTGCRTHSHTRAFREDEAKFTDPDAESKLRAYLTRIRHRRVPRQRIVMEKPSFVQRLLGWT